MHYERTSESLNLCHFPFYCNFPIVFCAECVLLPLTVLKILAKWILLHGGDPDDWGLVIIPSSRHVCLTQQLSHIAPQTGIWHWLKMSRRLTHSPIVSYPFGKQHDNYSGMQFCESFRWLVLDWRRQPTRADVSQQHTQFLSDSGRTHQETWRREQLLKIKNKKTQTKLGNRSFGSCLHLTFPARFSLSFCYRISWSWFFLHSG